MIKLMMRSILIVHMVHATTTTCGNIDPGAIICTQREILRIVKAGLDENTEIQRLMTYLKTVDPIIAKPAIRSLKPRILSETGYWSIKFCLELLERGWRDSETVEAILAGDSVSRDQIHNS